MKRRLEIARGLLHRPRVLFLDEPTVGLDPQTRTRIWDHVDELREARGVTVFMTTHYLDEAEHCDRIAIIDHGRSSPGHAAELKSRARRRPRRSSPATTDGARHVRRARRACRHGAGRSPLPGRGRRPTRAPLWLAWTSPAYEVDPGHPAEPRRRLPPPHRPPHPRRTPRRPPMTATPHTPTSAPHRTALGRARQILFEASAIQTAPHKAEKEVIRLDDRRQLCYEPNAVDDRAA